MLLPVFRQERPALVVTPPATDLQVPRRKSFTTETKATNKCPRCFVARLDVGFYAMQVQPFEGPPQRQCKPLTHVSTPRIRNKRIVADISAPEGAAHDLVDI